MSLRPLRPHQERALAALRASLTAGKRRPMLQAPTGFGKTLTAAHIIQRALDKGKRVATRVNTLAADHRREEIARMLAGAEITAEARAAAERLLKSATV